MWERLVVSIAVLTLTGCAGPETAPGSGAKAAVKQPHFTESIHALSFFKRTMKITGIVEKGKVRLGSICSAKSKAGLPALLLPVSGQFPEASELVAIEGFDFFQLISADSDSTGRAEELWDQYLTQKHRVFALADGDEKSGLTLFIWAANDNSETVCTALSAGHFAVSKGTRLNGIVLTNNALEVGVDDWHPSTDHVDFIGAGGQLLDRVTSNPARYALRGGEGYVRAHVFQDRLEGSELLEGRTRREAWTQAYYIRYD